MIIQLSDLGQVHLVCGKTDMRQGIDSLAYVVKTHFELDSFSGQVFLFCGGRKDRFKALYWDGQPQLFTPNLKTIQNPCLSLDPGWFLF
ncbi:IS66 family insertion sequence element accessory protein TnpB, partial [Streptococcus pneumoniae]